MFREARCIATSYLVQFCHINAEFYHSWSFTSSDSSSSNAIDRNGDISDRGKMLPNQTTFLATSWLHSAPCTTCGIFRFPCGAWSAMSETSQWHEISLEIGEKKWRI